MDLEEISCALCNKTYDEQERIPILLPDCGHSFCFVCITSCFESLKEENQKNNQSNRSQQEELIDNSKQTISRHTSSDHLQLVDKESDSSLNNSFNLQDMTIIAKLSHHFLEEELVKPTRLFRCPEDQIECSIQKPEQLPKNYALLKIVKKSQEYELIKNKKLVRLDFNKEENIFVQSTNNQGSSSSTNGLIEFCPQHNRPLELICVDDKTRICSQCALFGNHKGHDVRQEEDVTKEISLKVEVLMEMYQAMEQQCDDLNNPENYDKQQSIMRNKQNELKAKIQEQFKEWRKALRAMEMKAIDSLYGTFSQFDEKFSMAQKSNNQMISEAQLWMDKAKHQLDDYSLKTKDNPHYIPFDMIDGKVQSQTDGILNYGEQILDKAEKQKGFPSLNGFETQYNQVKLSFDQTFEKKLQNIAKVIGPGQQDFSIKDQTTASASFLPPFSFILEEEITENISQPINAESGLNLSNISFNELTSPCNDSLAPVVVPKQNHLTIKTLNNSKLNISRSSNTSSDMLQTSTHSAGEQLQAQELKQNLEVLPKESFANIKKSGKFQSQEGVKSLNIKKKNDLASIFKNETIDGELDISNQNLSDMHVNELAKCIKSTAHIKFLNISNNKLGDEGINHIMKALCDSQVEAVNLSSNKLTEKCVELIVGILKTNKNLKYLDLQGNGIQSRLMKNKLKNSLTQMEVSI
eukprot:403344461